MPDIQLVRQHGLEITPQERATVARVIFGNVDGLSDQDKAAWRRFWTRLLKLEAGDVMAISSSQKRLGWYHRKHMALEHALFRAQERIEQFSQFHAWLKVGAGLVDFAPGSDGQMVALPRSIAYAEMEQGEMEHFHAAAVDFVRSEHAGSFLWPHLSPVRRIEMVEAVLRGFDE